MAAESVKKNKIFLCSIIAVVVTLICLTPLFFSRLFETDIDLIFHNFFKIFLLLIPLGSIALCTRIKLNFLPRQKTSLFILLVFLTLLLVDIHYTSVDSASNYFKNKSNHEWQVSLHQKVLNLGPVGIPHTYRFLPNSMVRVFEYFTGDFSYARSLYRHTFMFILLFSLYYYARLYTGHSASLLAVLLYAAVYPISIRYYAGQLTDPLSHISFLWSFIFLELNIFSWFCLTIIIGIMAKESILIMPVYYFLVSRKNAKTWIKAGTLFAAGFILVLGIRFLVMEGDFKMDNVSGVGLSTFMHHISRSKNWWRQILYNVIIFLPFFCLAWKTTDKRPRNLALFLLPILAVTNALFSLLAETRNFMPAVFPLSVITADYLLKRFQRTNSDLP